MGRAKVRYNLHCRSLFLSIEIKGVFFWGSSENGRPSRTRKPSAHEAGRLPRDRKDSCFVNEKFTKTLENRRKN